MKHRWVALAGLVLALATRAVAAPPPTLAARLMTVDRATVWTLVAAIPVAFPTFHPQGMVRIGEEFFVSAVEIRRLPKPYPQPHPGPDRDAGEGVGHLFRISASGALLGDLILGQGDIYHPGGLDYDGVSIWVPVAEYRPDSRALIYRVDPRAMAATVALAVDDHIGAVAYDGASDTLQGVSWGARRFYAWPMGRPAGRSTGVAPKRWPNRASYIDYQDCHHLGRGQMLCSGVAGYRAPSAGPPFALGGWEIVNLKDHHQVWQSPIPLWTPAGRAMTQNPFFVEPTATGLRAYFMPDDDHSTIYVYDTVTPPSAGPPGPRRP